MKILLLNFTFLAVLLVILTGLANAQNQRSPLENIPELKATVQIGSGKARIDLARNYLQNKDWRQAAKLLRIVAMQQQEDTVLTAYMMLAEIRDKYIRPLYPKVSDEEYEQHKGSIGFSLVDKGNYDQGIDALIEEAWCLSAAAQIELEILYRYGVEPHKRYDERILEYYEESAKEGWPQAQFFLGNIYFNGWGIAKDQEKGQKLLEASDWKDSGFQLP